MVSHIKNKYFVEYHGVVMKLSEFAKLVGVDYNRLRHRVQRGQDPFDPLPEVRGETDDEVNALVQALRWENEVTKYTPYNFVRLDIL